MTRTGDRPVPVVTVYRHGARAGVAPMRNSHNRGVRGAVTGWSAGATRRNTQFLYSVREDQLTGVGFAVTLTVKECPRLLMSGIASGGRGNSVCVVLGCFGCTG